MHGITGPGVIETHRLACGKIEALRNVEVGLLLGPIMIEMGKQGHCPHFDTGADYPDSYRAEDLVFNSEPYVASKQRDEQ